MDMFVPSNSSIFVHIPKTGGNSITEYLVKNGQLPESVRTATRGQDGTQRFGLRDQIASKKHDSLQSQLVRLLDLRPNLSEVEVVFVGREPLDRLTSLALHGSDGAVSPIHIYHACFRAKSAAEFLQLDSRTQSAIRSRNLGLTFRCLRFSDLSVEVANWIGLGEEHERHDGHAASSLLPRRNTSKASAWRQLLTKVVVRLLLPFTKHRRDKFLLAAFEQDKTRAWEDLRSTLSVKQQEMK